MVTTQFSFNVFAKRQSLFTEIVRGRLALSEHRPGPVYLAVGSFLRLN